MNLGGKVPCKLCNGFNSLLCVRGVACSFDDVDAVVRATVAPLRALSGTTEAVETPVTEQEAQEKRIGYATPEQG